MSRKENVQKTRHFSAANFRGKSYGAQGWPKRSGTSSRFNSQNSRRPSARRRLGEDIDISRFIQRADEVAHEPAYIKHSFFDFAFCEELKNNLRKRNFKTPTPIQDQSIGHILDGRDLIGLANTGTGKTAAFLLPLIEKVAKDRNQKVLIIAPTRELALQIENEFHKFSWGMRIFSAVCVGGSAISRQLEHLRRRPSFVIGTPGRLKDLSKRGVLRFDDFGNIVLDEVDRMLDMGFIGEIKEMLANGPGDRQSVFFAATMPPKIRALAERFLKNPITVEVRKPGETTKNVEQDIIRVREKSMKFNQLQTLLSDKEVSRTLIFIETKREVEKLTTELVRNGYKANSIHGDKRQHQRQKALKQFKDSVIDILVATDVAARGLDIKEVSHVINYTVPQTFDDYVHRIGRTGRGSHKGKAYTFVD